MMPNTLQQIYLATKPVDMRLALTVYLPLSYSNWVKHPVMAPPMFLPIALAIALNWSHGTVTVSGYAYAAYIKVILCGHTSPQTPPPVGSAKPNGNGLSVAWIGHV